MIALIGKELVGKQGRKLEKPTLCLMAGGGGAERSRRGEGPREFVEERNTDRRVHLTLMLLALLRMLCQNLSANFQNFSSLMICKHHIV